MLHTRFHYSLDVFTAVVFAFLFFTNGAINVFAKQWELHGWRFILDIWPRDSCADLRYKWHLNDPVEDKKEWDMHEMWVTRGDIFLPPCCIPCCCLAGRQHVYSDSNMLDIMAAYFDWKPPGNYQTGRRQEYFEEKEESLKNIVQLQKEMN